MLATLEIAPSPPPCDIDSRFSCSRSAIAVMRPVSGIASPDTWTGTGVNALPPTALSVRVLTTKLVLNASTSTPRSAWYRTAASASPATNRSLIVTPRRFDASLRSSRLRPTYSRCRWRDRFAHSGEPPRTSLPEPRSAPTVDVVAVTTSPIRSTARFGSAGQIATSPASRRAIPTWRRTRWLIDWVTVAGEVVAEVAAGLLGGVGFDRRGDDPVEVDVVGRRVIGAELLVHLGHPQLPDAVGDRMVDDRPDRRAPAFQAVDHDEAPQRPGPIERFEIELRRRGRTAARSVPGSGRLRWRQWKSRSNSGSGTHAGGASRPSPGTTRS